MFSLKDFVKKGLLEGIGKMADYQILNNAKMYQQRGIFTQEDVAEIEKALDSRYPTEENIEPMSPMV